MRNKKRKEPFKWKKFILALLCFCCIVGQGSGLALVLADAEGGVSEEAALILDVLPEEILPELPSEDTNMQDGALENEEEKEIAEAATELENAMDESDASTDEALDEEEWLLEEGFEGEGMEFMAFGLYGASANNIQLKDVPEVTDLVEGNIYRIESYDDWKKLSDFSKLSNLENITFIVFKENGKNDTWDLVDKGIKIGNETYPFAGTIYCFYATTVIKTDKYLFDYLSSKAQIGYKENQNVYNFILSYTSHVHAGLAGNLVFDSSVDGPQTVYIGGENSNYYVKIAAGSKGISSSAGPAGGLFSRVYVEGNAQRPGGATEAYYRLMVNGTGIDLSGIENTRVKGTQAGGFFGTVKGDIYIGVTGLDNYITEVQTVGTTDSSAGALVGTIDQAVAGGRGVTIEFLNTDPIYITTKVQSSAASVGDGTVGYYVGGIVGHMKNSTLLLDDKPVVCRSELILGRNAVGGLIGYAKDCDVTVHGFTLDGTASTKGIRLYQYRNASAGDNYGVGSVIGRYEDSSASAGTSTHKLELSHIKTTNKNASVNSNIWLTAGNTSYNCVGGLCGVIKAGKAQVYIHDINTDADLANETANGGENCFVVNQRFYDNNNTKDSSFNKAGYAAGGLVSELAGENITIENVIFKYVSADNCMSGYLVADIAARTGLIDNGNYNTKIIAKDIIVNKNYCYYVSGYHAGLFGTVNQSLISLQGTIDLSGVPYVAVGNNYTNTDNGSNNRYYATTDMNSPNHYVILGDYDKRGFVAAKKTASTIFVAQGADFTRPITYENDAVKEFDPGNFEGSEIGTGAAQRVYTSTASYCIDDIGGNGTLFYDQNGIIDMSKPFGLEVTGALHLESAGVYEISDIDDALRFAIAGDSVKADGTIMFGANCFPKAGKESSTLTEILGYTYHLTSDLDLTTANIHGFVNNETLAYPFTGTLEGTGGTRTIHMLFLSRQNYGGLFPHVKNATFSNIQIKGAVGYTKGGSDKTVLESGKHNRAGAGAIAAFASGNNSLTNVAIDVAIHPSVNNCNTWNNNNMWAYGGVFGLYSAGDLTCTNCAFEATLDHIRNNSFTGGVVGFFVESSTTISNLTFTNCKLTTNISTDRNFNYWTQTNNRHARVGGLIGLLAMDYHDVGTTNDSRNAGASVHNATYARVTMDRLTISNSTLDYSNVVDNRSMLVCGGLLGYLWSDAEVIAKDITVENCEIKSRGVVGGLISYAAGKYDFSQIRINSLTMADIPNLSSHASYCGMLIGNGQHAFVTVKDYTIDEKHVSVSDYVTFDEIVGLNYNLRDGNGINYIYSSGQPVDAAYLRGGIVNIIDPKFADFDIENTAYRSYTNKVWNGKNRYTRYYYNLFTGSQDEWKPTVTETTATIENEKQWMTYEVASYATDAMQRFFTTDYLSGVLVQNIKNIQVTSDLDLNSYSWYPVTVRASGVTYDFNRHEVTLYAEEIYDLECDLFAGQLTLIQKDNQSKESQHYMMHAALFSNISSVTTIQNLKLQGTVADLSNNTGGLVCNSLSSSVSVKNITLDDLRVAHYNGGNQGLLIARVGVNCYGQDVNGTSLSLDTIKTVNYAEDGNPAGAALIGYVGTNTIENVQTRFNNLQLAYEKEDGKTYSKAFRHASLVYCYQYTEDLAKNKSYMLYTFTQADCNSVSPRNVTYGDEIRKGVQYVDADRTVGDELDHAIENANNNKYIPYVYMERNVYVNPRNGDITKGCGTYEDPYIIENAKQLLTLYLYLSAGDYTAVFNGNEGAGYDTTAGKWKVVPVGGEDKDTSACDLNDSDHTTHTVAAWGDANFPTREDLRCAYYKLAGDIDISAGQDMNDVNVAGEFSGLGSEKYPFAGVIIGTKAPGENYSIILPKQGTKRGLDAGYGIVTAQLTQSSLGLIEYMDGAVVKDLDIKLKEYDEVTGKVYYNVTDCGGAVAARVVGGDNIIDNVNVSIAYNTAQFKTSYSTALDSKTAKTSGIGGLVGVVENGALILRNMDNATTAENVLFEDFSKTYHAPTEGDAYSYAGAYSEHIGIYVGMVYDGYVLYEGYSSSSMPVLDRAQIAGSAKYMAKYPLVNGFHLINGAYMDANVAGIKVTSSGTDYQVSMHNAAELEIFTLALNSDALSVYYCTNEEHSYALHATGYGYKSRCRKASYDSVGAAGAKLSADRNAAVAYDDNKASNVGYLYPYVCAKYFDYSALNADKYTGYRMTLSPAQLVETATGGQKTISVIASKLNKVVEATGAVYDNADVVDGFTGYSVTYRLEKNAGSETFTYDLKPYGLSFRGIGGVYTSDYSDFRGSFDGQGNSVSYIMDRSFDPNAIMYSGFFNQLIYNPKVVAKYADDTHLAIKNLTILDSVVYNPKVFDEVNKSGTYVDAYGLITPASGQLVGQMQGCWDIKGVAVKRTSAISEQILGTGTIYPATVSGYKSVGGMVGRINATHKRTDWSPDATWINDYNALSNEIAFTGCAVLGTDTAAISVLELGTNKTAPSRGYRVAAVGGMIGGIATNYFHTGGYQQLRAFGDVAINACDMDYVTVRALDKGELGGMIGMIGIRYNNANASDAGGSNVGFVTINGDKVAAGVGTGNAKLSHITVQSENTSNDSAEMSSAGGMIGRSELPYTQAGEIVITNYVLSDLSIVETSVASYTARHENAGIGGVIGFNRSYRTTLDHVTVTASEGNRSVIGNDKWCTSVGGLIGDMYAVAVDHDASYAQYRTNTQATITNCLVERSDIRTGRGLSGGFIGISRICTLEIGTQDDGNMVRDCEVSAVNTGDSSSGGVIGVVYNNKANNYTGITSCNVNVTNMEVVDTIVANGINGAGGILGYLNRGNYKEVLTLENVYVYSTATNKSVIYSDSYAGGILARQADNDNEIHFKGTIGIGSYYEDDSWEETTYAGADYSDSGVRIAGKNAGGLIGCAKKKNSEKYDANIRIANNVIYAYTTTNTQSPGTYSGGLFGYWEMTQGSRNYTFGDIEVENNVIANGGDTYTKNRSRTDLGMGSGGLFGYVKIASSSDLYFPYVTLSDNSIGYYDVSGAQRKVLDTDNFTLVTDWTKLTVASQDVKLYEINSVSVKTMNYREIEELSDSTIGSYAVGFGNFVGIYKDENATVSMMYILDPTVSMSKAVGSLPVIDVGCKGYTSVAPDSAIYQEVYPYNYQKLIHIVYIDDMEGTSYEDIEAVKGDRKPVSIAPELLINGESEYSFGSFGTQVEAYRNLNEGVEDLATKNYNYIRAKRLDNYLLHTDGTTKYALCTGDKNYYDLTYNVKNDLNQAANIYNGVPVLVLDGLNPQSVGDYAAAILTNNGGVISEDMIKSQESKSNKRMQKRWSITCENAYIDVDGTIKRVDTTDPANPFYGSDHTGSSIVVKSGTTNRLNLSNSLYDGYISNGVEDEKLYTITLLCYTYSCPTVTGEDYVRTLYIPVFVKEKVSMDSYIRILSNEEYALDVAQTSGYRKDVSISHDSTYTIYAEFVYDRIRNKANFVKDKVEKSIFYEANATVIPIGTRFTLIDYQTGIAYYYTADGTEYSHVAGGNEIPFASFLDAQGNPYVQRVVSSASISGVPGISDAMSVASYTSIGYKDSNQNYPGEVNYAKVSDSAADKYGIERYFIVVEPPENEVNANFTLNIKTYAYDGNGLPVDEFFNKNTNGDVNGVNVTCLPGPKVQFGGVSYGGVYGDTLIGAEDVTYISGKISVDETVDISANVEVVLKNYLSPYWKEKNSGNTIDSANTDKFLEVAVTLVNESGEVVPWPAGTNISINGSPNQLLLNNLITYMYKDGQKEFSMNTLVNDLTGSCYYYNVNEDAENPDYRWLYYDEIAHDWYYYDGLDLSMSWIVHYLGKSTLEEAYIDLTNQMNISLDFASADIEDYAGNSYQVVLKLYRSDDAEYPNEGTTRSYGDSIRQYSDTIMAEAKKELAAVVTVDDLMDLGINLYDESNVVHDITFTNKFDYSSIIHKNSMEKDIKDWSTDATNPKKYLVTYRLYKKVDEAKITPSGVDTDAIVGYNNAIAPIKDAADPYVYQLIDWEDSPFTLYDAQGNVCVPKDIVVNPNADASYVEEENVIQTTVGFTANDIKHGVSADPAKAADAYVTEWGMTLKVNAPELERADITNYMVFVTYLPYEEDAMLDSLASVPTTDQNETLSDFFIFTIGSLKNDL